MQVKVLWLVPPRDLDINFNLYQKLIGILI